MIYTGLSIHKKNPFFQVTVNTAKLVSLEHVLEFVGALLVWLYTLLTLIHIQIETFKW